MRRRTTAGFTLLEMIIAVVIGGISVLMAAQIAQTVMRQNAKGKQRTDFTSRSRLLGKQLRSDLKLAGIGATGAVAVDPGSGPFGAMSFQTASGFWAIPVIAGATNVPASAGTLNFQAGSDAIQLVVPNPSQLIHTQDRATAGTNVLTFAGPPGEDAGALAGCTMVYISDHSAPNGSGRAQVAFLNAVTPATVQLDGTLQFTVAPGSDVMCARISTYWVDDQFMFRRNDLTVGGTVVRPVGNAWAFIDSAATDTEVSPGVLDLQIAYRVSSEVYRAANAAPPGDPDQQWAYTGSGANADASMNTPASWFEVRMVRINILGRTLRRIDTNTDARAYARLEDGVGLPPIPVSWNHTAEWISTTETVTNLRYYDFGAPERVPAEPY